MCSTSTHEQTNTESAIIALAALFSCHHPVSQVLRFINPTWHRRRRRNHASPAVRSFKVTWKCSNLSYLCRWTYFDSSIRPCLPGGKKKRPKPKAPSFQSLSRHILFLFQGGEILCKTSDIATKEKKQEIACCCCCCSDFSSSSLFFILLLLPMTTKTFERSVCVWLCSRRHTKYGSQKSTQKIYLQGHDDAKTAICPFDKADVVLGMYCLGAITCVVGKHYPLSLFNASVKDRSSVAKLSALP